MKLLILVAGVIGGSMASMFVRWSTAPSPVLVVYRMFFAVLLLAPVAWMHRAEFRYLPKKTLGLCVCSGIALGLHFATYFESVKNTSMAASSVLVNMEVLLVAFVSVTVLRRRYTKTAWLGILLAFCGAVIIALGDTGGANGNALWGDVLALISAMMMGTYTMLGGVCRKTVSTTVYTYLVYLVAMVTVLAIMLAGGIPLFGHGSVNFATAFGMAVCCTLLGHSIFSWCLKYLEPSLVSTMRQMDPMFAALWGLLIFGERPGLPVILGGMVIILGVVLYGRATAVEE